MLLEIRNVSKNYDTLPVLHDCCLSIAVGEVVVVCGPSGSGKSILIKTLNVLEGIDAGQILFQGKSILQDPRRLPVLRAKLGMVFQSFELFPHLTGLQNLTIAQTKVLKRPGNEARARALPILEKVRLGAFGGRYPGQLSGGHQQRVAIARALAMDPVAIYFDEPTSALDPKMVAEVLDVMTTFAAEGMTMVVVTHEMGFARRVASRVVFMGNGKILEDESNNQFFGSPKTERAKTFLSKIFAH